MRRLIVKRSFPYILALVLPLLGGPAFSQQISGAGSGVQVSGTPSTGNCAKWVSPTAIGDSGGACGGAGSSAWSSLTAATANLLLANTTYTSNITGTAATGSLLTLDSSAGTGEIAMTVKGSSSGDAMDIFTGAGKNFSFDKNGNLNVINGAVYASYLNASNSIIVQNPGDVKLSNGGNVYLQSGGHQTIQGAAPTDLVGMDVIETATNALTANQLVCLDTANAHSVVVCATSTTAQFVGFVTNAPAAAANANVLVMGKASPVTTSACTIGQYVTPSATTAGDVDCTSTQPALGKQVGWAETAASASAAVTVLIDKR